MKYLLGLALAAVAGAAYVWRSWEKSLHEHLMDSPPVHGLPDDA